MKEQAKEAIVQVPAEKAVRAALIASETTLSDYSTFLEHLLVGLADEAIPAMLVCPPRCEIDSVVSPHQLSPNEVPPYQSNNLSRVPNWCGAEIVRHPAINLPFMGRQNRKWLVEQLLKFRPTLLHCLCESKAGLTKQLAQQLDLPYLLMINSLRQAGRPFFYFGKKAGGRAGAHLSISIKHCAGIVVPAQTIADDVARSYPHLAERIEPINIGAFVEDKTRCFSERSHLGPRSAGTLTSMLAAHPLDSTASFESLFGAIRHLSIDGYEFALVVMGAGRAEGQLRKFLAALDLLQTITIVPRLRPWRSVLAAGDIFIQFRPNAAFNPLLLEAMSVGLAIAACKGGVDDLIIEDRTAAVFDPTDELSIRGSLQRLLDRPEFARKLARGAQSYLRANHSVSNMILATVQAYQQAQQWFGQTANR